MSSPGWYPDPDGGGWRWWDGTTWGPRHSPDGPDQAAAATPLRSRPNVLDFGIDLGSDWALRVSTLVAVVAGCAAIVAGGVILYTYLVGPFPAAPVLVLPAVPVLFAGQLWCILILNGRANDRRRSSDNPTRWWRSRFGSDLRAGLPRPVAVLFVVLFYGAFVVGPGSTFWGWSSDTPQGVLTDDPSKCDYSSNNHGTYRCLTESEYDREQATTQRFAAGVMLGFFVAHCGVATGEVLLRRERSTDPGDSSEPRLE